jgi:HD-GYP domain-containing protein (c-di-GMP phosphodiesterase class II)
MSNSQDRIRRPPGDSQALPRVDAFVPTVLAWRALNEWDEVKGQVVRSDARVADLLLGLVRDTAAASYDETRLLNVIADYALRAFPNATNFVLVRRDPETDDLVVLRAQTHAGEATETVQLSRTIAERAMREDCALLYVNADGGGSATESQVLSRMETAICAPLRDPETAQHSERVRDVAVWIARQFDLPVERLEVVRVSALLHDLGKQGVRDEVLFKPDRLTEAERTEMDTHAAHTQNILDRIVYPVALRDVPRIAAWHHEKMDGTGPFGVPGDQIPLESRILSVADVFDALMSPRPYREALSPRRALMILENGENVDWDAEVVAALRTCLHDVLADVYAVGGSAGEADSAAA